MLIPSQSGNLSPEPLPVESRIKEDKSDFEEQQRHRIAQEVRTERRQKKQVSSAEENNSWCPTASTQPDRQLLSHRMKSVRFVNLRTDIFVCVCVCVCVLSDRSVSPC